MNVIPHFDPKLDLMMERVVDVPPELVWAAWTKPEHIVHWFTPAPWKTIDCEIDLKPGGLFATTMQSPEGKNFPNNGCYLEVIENRKLTWTNAMLPGFRPSGSPVSMAPGEFLFTAGIVLRPEGRGTRYTAFALHRNEGERKVHADMGFEGGWGTALNQLVAYMKARR